jgi:thymidylate synthase
MESWKERGFHLSKEEFIERIKTDPEFAAKWGELGPIYGKQWRAWRTIDDSEMKIHTYEIDQIVNSINLFKTDPDSRRNIVSAWNAGEIDQMVLPPCHNFFQFYTRELNTKERLELLPKYYPEAYKEIKFSNYMDVATQEDIEYLLNESKVPKRSISLMWNQRSVDTFLGLPFNIASYGLLLEIIAKEVNMIPDEIIGNLGDVHLYLNHFEQVDEQLKRDSFPLPQLDIKLHFENKPSFVPELWLADDFQIVNYQSHPAIKAPLSN